MDSESTRAEVEARLRETASAMSDRFDALQEEVSGSGLSLGEWVARNPWKSVGGMLAAGVAVGALFGGRRSQQSEQAELLNQYVEALRAEVDEAIASGDTPGEALEKALRGRAPLVVYREGDGERTEARASGSLLGGTLGFVFRVAAREVVRELILSWLDDVDPEDLMGEEIPE